MSENVMGKNLFENYEVNCRQYTDNIPSDFLIGISKKEFIEYEQQKEEIERLNNIIEEYKNANKYHQKIIHELETMKQPNQLHSENVKLRAENNRLNNIIKRLEEDLREMYLTFGEFSEEYTEKCIKKLKGSDKE